MTKIISLFSGCGGLDLGFKMEGYQFVYANDFLEDVCTTYRNNIGLHIHCKNICDIDIEEIPPAKLIIGGPPCQSFSLLGKRRPDDKRGKLAWKFLEIIEAKTPKIFLFENVLGIKSAKTKLGEKVITKLKKEFKKIGYRVQIFTLNAANYGVPQKRVRVFIVGSLDGIRIKKPIPTHNEKPQMRLDNKRIKKWVTAKEAISDLPKPSNKEKIPYNKDPENNYQELMRINSKTVSNHFPPYASEKDMQIIKSIPPGGNYMDVPDEIATKRILNFKKTGGRTTTYGRLHPNEPAYTINTYFNRPNVGCNIHYKEDRLITIREALRLQSFPDDFIIYSSTKRNYYLQVGNAVPVLLSQAWAKRLKEYL